MSGFFLVALNLGLLVGAWPLIRERLFIYGNTPTRFCIFIGAVAAGIFILHIPLLILKNLNYHLSRANERMMARQVFWSCWFLLIFPFGTLLHLGVLYYMLFSRETYEIFDREAWDAPRPYWGLVRFVSVIGLAALIVFVGIPLFGKGVQWMKERKPAPKKASFSAAGGMPAAPEALMSGLNKLAEGQNQAFDKLSSELKDSGSSVTGVLKNAQREGNERHENMMNQVQNGNFGDIMKGQLGGGGSGKSSSAKKVKPAAPPVKKGKNAFDKFFEKWFTPAKPAPAASAASSAMDESDAYDKETGNIFI